MSNEPNRETLVAHLRSKKSLSGSSQTWHLEFTADAPFAFIPGQFISVLAQRTYPTGHARAGESRMDTRAYSLASAPAGASFDLCLNRLDTEDGHGFFSNLLCDLAPGDSIRFQGRMEASHCARVPALSLSSPRRQASLPSAACYGPIRTCPQR